MGPLGGLAGLYGSGGPYGETGQTLTNSGRPVDARHSIGGEASVPVLRKYSAPDYGSEVDVADAPATDVLSGVVYDHTPASHAAPWPRGIQHDPVEAGEATRELHGVDYGGVEFHVKGHTPPEISYTSGRFDSPQVTGAAPNVPGQLRGGGVDPTQGYGVGNSGVFGQGNQFRRAASEGITFDRTMHHAGERPFLGAHPAKQTRYDGQDSPYGPVYGDTSRMGLNDTPHGDPTPYQQPSNPTVSPVGPVADEVQDYGWSAG